MNNKNSGAFPSGMNMNNFVKQAKKMQEDLLKAQDELAQKSFEVTSGGGAIKVVMNGKKKLLSINISPDVVDKDDIEMLQDLIISAINEAIRQADEAAAASMGKLAGGLSSSGLF